MKIKFLPPPRSLFKNTFQHEGPGPGEYNLKAPPAGSITSCFRSKVPRFLPVGSVSMLSEICVCVCGGGVLRIPHAWMGIVTHD